jgi:hypothetical protein
MNCVQVPSEDNTSSRVPAQITQAPASSSRPLWVVTESSECRVGTTRPLSIVEEKIRRWSTPCGEKVVESRLERVHPGQIARLRDRLVCFRFCGGPGEALNLIRSLPAANAPLSLQPSESGCGLIIATHDNDDSMCPCPRLAAG